MRGKWERGGEGKGDGVRKRVKGEGELVLREGSSSWILNAQGPRMKYTLPSDDTLNENLVHCKIWTHLCHSLLAVSSPSLRQFVSWAPAPASTTAEIKQWRGRNKKLWTRGGQDGKLYLLHWSWLTLASCLQLFYDACKWNDLDTMPFPHWPSHKPTLTSHTPYPHLSFLLCWILSVTLLPDGTEIATRQWHTHCHNLSL